MLLHGLSVSVHGPNENTQYSCKVEMKPWYFWRKQGSKHFSVDGWTVGVFWDLKAAKFHGETAPLSDYYVAVVCEEEVVLLVGDLKKDAYRRTGCRPALIEPILVSRKEHVFGKKRFSTRIKLHEKGRPHEISVECSNFGGGFDPEMQIRIDGHLGVQVKHLQWKFRGNQCIHVNRTSRLHVYWDAHDWLFGSAPRHALFIFKPTSWSPSSPSPAQLSAVAPNYVPDGDQERSVADGSSRFCLIFYAWKVE